MRETKEAVGKTLENIRGMADVSEGITNAKAKTQYDG